MKKNQVWQKGGYTLRLAQPGDADGYFQNFNPLDQEVARLTGCKRAFTWEEVMDFFQNAIDTPDFYLFLIHTLDGRVVGESILNEINWELRKANFRIGIFNGAERGKGLGTWAAESVRDYAFAELKLHRLELDVFSFNPAAEGMYRKIGFKREGVLRDAVRDGDTYADDILMAILEDEWRMVSAQNPPKEKSENSLKKSFTNKVSRGIIILSSFAGTKAKAVPAAFGA